MMQCKLNDGSTHEIRVFALNGKMFYNLVDVLLKCEEMDYHFCHSLFKEFSWDESSVKELKEIVEKEDTKTSKFISQSTEVQRKFKEVN